MSKSLPIPTPGTRFLQKNYVNGRLISQRIIRFEGVDTDQYLLFSVPGTEREHVHIAPSGWLTEKSWATNPGVELKTQYQAL